jgi:hypothetical protein
MTHRCQLDGCALRNERDHRRSVTDPEGIECVREERNFMMDLAAGAEEAESRF